VKPTSKADSNAVWRSASVVGALAMAALVLVFLLPSQLLFSSHDTDLIGGDFGCRSFTAHVLASGHIPLWNPYTYSGQPFLGGFHTAVLYPPNWLNIILPLPPAVNFSFLLHLVLLGWGMERWATYRGLHPWAAALAGVIMPFSGAVFPQIYAGHLIYICTMAWAPWIFLGLEKWVLGGDRRGLLLASAGICLQILAGHIQYFFYTAVAVGLQAVVISVAEPKARWRALPAVVICYLAGIALGAAQLLPGLDAATEGIRQHKLDHDFAAMFGFPPENFLTFIAPGFFGSLPQPAYWGRCYLWEMSCFVGTASLPLIALACCDSQRRRQAYLNLIVAGVLIVLALGVHTPLFEPLYDFAPGFGSFRSWSKFMFQATLFLVMTVAAGADFLLREKRPVPRVAWVSIVAGGVAAVLGFFLVLWPESISGMFDLVAASNESYLPAGVFTNLEFIRQGGTHAGLSLGLGGLVLMIAGAALIFRGKWPMLRWAVPALVAVEMIGFVSGLVTTSSVSDTVPDDLKQFVSAHPGDYRVLDLTQPNNGYLLGAGDLWGNNPALLRRYAEFMTFTQGHDPNSAVQYLAFTKIDPLYALLRFRYAFVPSAQGMQVAENKTPPLSRLLLVSDWKAPGNRDAIFSALRDDSFVPAKTALLENTPEPMPQPGAVGTARLVAETPEELTIEVDTDRPALLLVTDLYAKDWKAEALPGSVQLSYQIMPADYILRAVPLQAGHHRLRMVYDPTSFTIGVWLSVIAWAIWAGLWVWMWKKER
jgi:hypothetical protein